MCIKVCAMGRVERAAMYAGGRKQWISEGAVVRAGESAYVRRLPYLWDYGCVY